jgi:hypothetical protein
MNVRAKQVLWYHKAKAASFGAHGFSSFFAELF